MKMPRVAQSTRPLLRTAAIALSIAFAGCECHVGASTQPAASPAPTVAPAPTYDPAAPPPAPAPMRRTPASDAG